MTAPADWLDILKSKYPKRSGGNGWAAVPRLLAPHLDSWDEIVKGTENYYIHVSRAGKLGTELVQQARTFYGRDMWWQEFAALDIRSPAQRAQDAEWQDLEERARRLGFTTVDRSRGISVARIAIESAERTNTRKVTEPLLKIVQSR